MAKKDDTESWMDYSIHIPSRTLYMGSEGVTDDLTQESGTDFRMAERMIKGIHILDARSDDDITIIINNVGGDEYHGMAIYDAIKHSRCAVTLKVFGHAMSMGSVILQAADKRIMAPSSRMMIHYGTWGIHDHPKTTYKWADEGKRFDTWMEDLYLEKIHEKQPKFTRKRLQEMLDHDTFFTAEEAVKLGLADEVLKSNKK